MARRRAKRHSRHQKIAVRARRRRHAAHAGRITGNTTVYVSSAGWRDNDTSMQVVGTNKAVVSKLIHKMMEEAAERAYDEESYASVDDAMDGIAYYGIHKFTLKDIIPRPSELLEAIREIGDLGYYYPNVG